MLEIYPHESESLKFFLGVDSSAARPGRILGGTGTINGNVLVAGTMVPGDVSADDVSLVTPGTLSIVGNYEQASTGLFDEQMSLFSHAFLDVSVFLVWKRTGTGLSPAS